MLKNKIENLKYIICIPYYRIKNYWHDCYITYIRYLSGVSGERKRYNYYKKRLKYLGNDVKIDTGVFIEGAEYISIDSGTHIDKNCMLIASAGNIDLGERYVKRVQNVRYTGNPGEIYVGKHCHLSQNTMVFGAGGVYIGDCVGLSAGAKVYSMTSLSNNPYDKSEVVSILPFDGKSPTMIGSVVLMDNAWLGLNAVINPGCYLGKYAFACSDSMIMSSFEDNSYIGGCPASYIKERFKENKV